MKEIIESYFRQRSLVNHQLASYNDCIPRADSQGSRFEKIVRNIRIGTDEIIEDEEGGMVINVGDAAAGSTLGTIALLGAGFLRRRITGGL